MAVERLRRDIFLAAGEVSVAALLGAATARANTGVSAVATTATGLDLNVQQFGARGDGENDDAPAINAALSTMRQQHLHVGKTQIGARLIFPPGLYAVSSPLDCTNLRALNTVFLGAGSVILGRCPGKPVIDAMGSRWLTFRDLSIVGDPAFVPSIGIQIGIRAPHEVADSHRLEDVKIFGHFSLACLYNRAAETSEFDHVLLWNDEPRSFCLIQDGLNHFGLAPADYATELPVETSLSFNENIFISCDFRHGAGGTPVWLGDTARHAFVRCYSTTQHGPSFILYCGNNSHTMLYVDCHCESFGLENVFTLSAKRDNIEIYGLTYRDHSTFASGSILSADAHIKRLCIQDANLDIASCRVKSCRLFDEPQRWRVLGSYKSGSAESWNGMASFAGIVSLGDHLSQTGSNGTKVDAGPTNGRPASLLEIHAGRMYFDTSLNKLLVWAGSRWVDANGDHV